MERNSNSLILKNILDNESCELKQMIDAFMSDKLAEFQQQVKTNVDKVVIDRLSKFYNPSSLELDNIIFDEEPATYAIQSCIEQCERNVRSCTDMATNKYYSTMLEDAKTLSGQKMFTICLPQSSGYSGGYLGYVFKNYILEPWCGGSPVTYGCFKHPFPSSVLLTLKVYSKPNTNGVLRTTQLINYYEEHPQYFQPNCIEFERICKQEHEEIARQKEEFGELIEESHRILDENVDKKEYYASLDARLDQIRIDEERIKEEKQKLLIVKERLLEMKSELERERQSIEEEKRKLREQKEKSIDINQCFADLL
jgi:hypothetical protein